MPKAAERSSLIRTSKFGLQTPVHHSSILEMKKGENKVAIPAYNPEKTKSVVGPTCRINYTPYCRNFLCACNYREFFKIAIIEKIIARENFTLYSSR